jgi:hypothetical protein
MVEHTPRERITWEHHRVESHDPMPAADLDALGRDGWQLCGVVRSGGLVVHIFRRPLPPAGPSVERR